MTNKQKNTNLKHGKELECKIQEFTEYLKFQHFSDSIIKKYNSHLQKFYSYCITNHIKHFYSKNIISKYINSLSSNYCEYFIHFARKVLHRFSDFYFNGYFNFYYVNPISLKSKQFNHILSMYEEHLKSSEISISTQNVQLRIIKRFLFYIENHDILSLQNFFIKEYIFKYINSPTLSHSTKSNYSKNIKKFLNFTFKNQLSKISGDSIFPRIHRNSRERILSFYSSQEISSVINSIDTTTPIGKRDYVIALLASTLGLRAGDIVNLKLENFDFDKKHLKIIQQKTKKPLIQPFTDEILFSLLDYLKNGRPNTNTDYIFIRYSAPFDKLTPSCLSTTITRYFKLAGIDISTRKHGMHSLRHSLANNLLHNNVSLQDVSATLGHSYISTTTMYTNIDLKTLKLLSLEVCD